MSKDKQNSNTSAQNQDNAADKKDGPSTTPQAGGQSSQSLSGQSRNQFTGESQTPQNNNNSLLNENNLRKAGNAEAGSGNHKIWKEALKEYEERTNKKTKLEYIKKMFIKNHGQSDLQTENDSKSYSMESNFSTYRQQDATDFDYERNFLKENKQKRHDIAQKSRIAIEKNKYQILRKAMADTSFAERFGEVGEAKQQVADWRKVLKKSIEEEDSRWSYRRSNAANDYMARVEEIEEESKAKTQVMIDVSRSVSGGLIREFLRQIKPILKGSEVEVGFFDDIVYDFKKIKKAKDIDNLHIPSGGGTDIDNAVRAFSRKKEINKIVFTDGHGYMPEKDLAKMNVLWIIYDNDDFNPVCGKVIYVDKIDILTHNHNYDYMSRAGYSR